MVNKIFNLILILFFIITYTACSEEEDDPCEGMEYIYLPIMTFDDVFTIDSINCWLKEGIGELDVKGELHFRIDDQVQFDTLVDCNCELPTINFDDYTLLMGKIQVAGSGTLASHEVLLNCDKYHVGYSLDIFVDTTVADGVYYFQYNAAIPKLPNDIKVYYSILTKK